MTSAAQGPPTYRRWCSLLNRVFRSRRASSIDSWTFDLLSWLSASWAKAFSSWIASFSQFLDSSKNVAFKYGVRAAAAIAAQRAACVRHSFGSPGMVGALRQLGGSATGLSATGAQETTLCEVPKRGCHDANPRLPQRPLRSTVTRQLFAFLAIERSVNRQVTTASA
jgi:hypothetical protein